MSEDKPAAPAGKPGDPVLEHIDERVAPRYFDADGHPCYAWNLTSCKLTDPVMLYMPRPNVIPIVFVPGIMGSNLKAKKDILHPRYREPIARKDDRVWNVDTLTGGLRFWEGDSWLGKSAARRQLVLNKDVVAVDDRGLIELRAEETAEWREFISHPQYANLPAARKARQLSEAMANLSADKRRRGWGTVSWFSYGPFLNWLDKQLNDAAIRQGKPNAVLKALLELAGSTPKGAKQPPPALTEAGIRQLPKFRFPVYAVGYNWLQSNLVSGQELAKKINDIITHYQNAGYDCEQVIVITHSMGGLVTRAASQEPGMAEKILAVIHGVMPTDGAAAFYKRFVGGFADEGEGFGKIMGAIAAQVLGRTAQETTPVLAYGPGPMELAPNHLYHDGGPWLFIKDKHGTTLKALPDKDEKGVADPYGSIYRTDAWWRAVNPAWLNPAGLPGNPLFLHVRELRRAEKYHRTLGDKFHTPTYAYYGVDPEHKSWGKVTWRAAVGLYYEPGWQEAMPGDPSSLNARWIDHPGRRIAGEPKDWNVIAQRTDVPANIGMPERYLHDGAGQPLRCRIEPPADPGDGTVPGEEGAKGVTRANPVVLCCTTGYDHQGSYNDDDVRLFVIDAIVRALAKSKVTA